MYEKIAYLSIPIIFGVIAIFLVWFIYRSSILLRHYLRIRQEESYRLEKQSDPEYYQKLEYTFKRLNDQLQSNISFQKRLEEESHDQSNELRHMIEELKVIRFNKGLGL